jgi:hypothetical protein
MVFIAVGERRVRTCVQVVHVARQRVCTPQLPGCFYLLSSAVAASLAVLVLVMARLGGRSCRHNGRRSGGAGLDEPSLVWPLSSALAVGLPAVVAVAMPSLVRQSP